MRNDDDVGDAGGDGRDETHARSNCKARALLVLSALPLSLSLESPARGVK